MWKSANFWPILCPDGEKFCDFVRNVVYLPNDKQFFMSGRSVGSMFGNAGTLIVDDDICFNNACVIKRHYYIINFLYKNIFAGI